MTKAELQRLIDTAVSDALADQVIRIELILKAPEAEGRRDLAMTMALNSTLSADSAITLLKAAPKENRGRDLWLNAMRAEGPLDLAADHAPVASDKKAARMDQLREAAGTVRAAKYGLPPVKK